MGIVEWDDSVGKEGVLGKGAYGTAIAGKHINEEIYGNAKYVIKQLNKVNVQSVKNEAIILKHLSTLHHSNILEYIGCSSHQDVFYIITKYNDGYIDVSEYMKTINYNINENPQINININNCIVQLYEGLHAIHSKHVFHCDIKPDNIIINPQNGNIKYIDFGKSNAAMNTDFTKYLIQYTEYHGGTPAFVPYWRKPNNHIKTRYPNLNSIYFYKTMIWCDYWALAVTICQLINPRKQRKLDLIISFIYIDKDHYDIDVLRHLLLTNIDDRLDKLKINHYIKVSQILFPTNKTHGIEDMELVLIGFMKIHSNTKDNKGIAPIHVSVAQKIIGKVNLLIQNGATVNVTDNDGKTPLHYAVNANQLNIATVLIQNGATVNVTDNDGKTPLDIATDKNLTDIIKILNADSTPQNDSTSGSTPQNDSTSGSTPQNGSTSGSTPQNGSTSDSTPQNGSTSDSTPQNDSTSDSTPQNDSTSGSTQQNGSTP